MRRRPALILAERVLFALGVLLVLFWLWSNWAAARFQAAASRQLESAMRIPESEEPKTEDSVKADQTRTKASKVRRKTSHARRAPLARREVASTGLVGRISIPRLGITSVIAQGVDSKTLSQSVGHVPGTAYPGESGSVGLAGHRDGIFRKLSLIRPRDLIVVTTPDGEFAYRVDSTAVVPPERTDVLRARRDPSVILVTCFPFRWIGPAPNRFIVWAGSKSKVAAEAKPEARPSRRGPERT
jgi:LPXTG-site transpeptidase (sortase) family protein